MKNIKDLGEKVAIQCKTPEAFIKIKRQLNAINLEDNYWGNYKENTCIRPSDNTFSGLDFFIEEGYTIHQASDFMPLSPQDEIKELKARIATLEETLRPKKKIEFVKACNRHKDNLGLNNPQSEPKEWEHIELICKATSINYYDVMFGYDKNRNEGVVFLGHFNGGIK